MGAKEILNCGCHISKDLICVVFDLAEVHLRIFDLKSQSLSVQDGDEAIQNISPDQNIGAVGSDATHGSKIKTLDEQLDVINRTQ